MDEKALKQCTSAICLADGSKERLLHRLWMPLDPVMLYRTGLRSLLGSIVGQEILPFVQSLDLMDLQLMTSAA